MQKKLDKEYAGESESTPSYSSDDAKLQQVSRVSLPSPKQLLSLPTDLTPSLSKKTGSPSLNQYLVRVL